MIRSKPSFSTRTTISSISMRTIRLRVAMVAPWPSALDVGAEPEQRLAFAWAYAIRGHYAEGIELVLEPSLLFQALVPTPLQFSGNQSVVGIDGVILPSGVRRFETRLLDRQFDLPALLGVFAPARPQSRQRRLDAQRLNTLDHLRGNRTVDTKTAEGDAALHAVVDQGSSAVIARDVTFGPAVGDVQLASAVAATEQPGQQSLSPPHRAAARPALAVGVVVDQALIPLERIPTNIALMVVTDQNLPV